MGIRVHERIGARFASSEGVLQQLVFFLVSVLVESPTVTRSAHFISLTVRFLLDRLLAQEQQNGLFSSLSFWFSFC